MVEGRTSAGEGEGADAVDLTVGGGRAEEEEEEEEEASSNYWGTTIFGGTRPAQYAETLSWRTGAIWVVSFR